MSDGWYETREITCYARAARERWEREHSGQDKRPEPGTLVLVEDTRHTSS